MNHDQFQKRSKEQPGAKTPWTPINQLLAPDERFILECSEWKGFVFAPKHSSQLIALLYHLRQEGISVSVQGKRNSNFPRLSHSVMISPRYFSNMRWHEQGLVEVGGGVSLSQLHAFLFEYQQEVALEEAPLVSPKNFVAGLILSGRTAGIHYRGKGGAKNIVGLEFVSWEGNSIKWGGVHRSAVAGPHLHSLIWGLQSLPGIILNIIFKTYPIPPKRLRLAWGFRQKEALWEYFDQLKQISPDWESLDVVFSGNSSDQSFIFAQISGCAEEIEAFSQICPGYFLARQQRERLQFKHFFEQQSLWAYPVAIDHPLESEEYLWIQSLAQQAWLLTRRKQEEPKISCPLWKERFLASL